MRSGDDQPCLKGSWPGDEVKEVHFFIGQNLSHLFYPMLLENLVVNGHGASHATVWIIWRLVNTKKDYAIRGL